MDLGGCGVSELGGFDAVGVAAPGRRKVTTMSGRTIEALRVGMAAELAKTYDEWGINTFAALIGDLNPAHVDEAFAERTIFETRSGKRSDQAASPDYSRRGEYPPSGPFDPSIHAGLTVPKSAEPRRSSSWMQGRSRL